MAHIVPERSCQLQATTSAWWADADAKYILACRLTRECSTYSSAKWINVKNEEVEERNKMTTKDEQENWERRTFKWSWTPGNRT